MLELYERISNLCTKKGVTVSEMCRELKINRSSLSELKRGRSKSLSADKISKISDYFNVSEKYLLGLTDTPKVTRDQNTVEDDDIKFALFNNSDNITDEMFEKVKAFAKFIEQEEENKKK